MLYYTCRGSPGRAPLRGPLGVQGGVEAAGRRVVRPQEEGDDHFGNMREEAQKCVCKGLENGRRVLKRKANYTIEYSVSIDSFPQFPP